MSQSTEGKIRAGGEEFAVDPELDPRGSSFLRDVAVIARRSIRQLPREPEAVFPALMIPVFFMAVNIGSLEKLTESALAIDYKAFQLPVGIVFAVTGISRGASLVADLNSGYFDRLLMTPVSRLALLIGTMAADFVLVAMMTLPVLCLGFIVGVGFYNGILGFLVFIAISALWGMVFPGFTYAIAFKTASPAAVASATILFFPFAFLTTTFLPKDQLNGALGAVANVNPVTYILEALRSLLSGDWNVSALAPAFIAIILVGILSIGAALTALMRRVSRS
ncbi:ABC transporter permease [Nocardia suismassiliense]|uniref:Transport permease protein n=1 Tax=Nocardia suismassiliense TaxID=2077092 RepID=A0ABW6R0Q5_9NOCA|nr:ABC transporter permease [Nocardia sp. XZ_19_369]